MYFIGAFMNARRLGTTYFVKIIKYFLSIFDILKFYVNLKMT